MADPGPALSTWTASDGYPIHVATWPTPGPTRGRVVILHGVQSHGGWYHRLGRTLAEAGYEAHFPDRRGSGSNRKDRGHAPSSRRLIDDVTEYVASIRSGSPPLPTTLAGISWGGKIAVIAAARRPDLIDALALICPGLQPRVGVTSRERRAIAWAYFTNRRKTFPIPLSDPALFTDNHEAQTFIANDPLGLRAGTAGLLAASAFLDRGVRRSLRRVRQPSLLILAGHDRIVDNDKTRADFARIPSAEKQIIEYPEGHHTLEFDPDPSAYAHALIAWLQASSPARP
ncbi:alpha/beta fold hydrolase [Tundrisphaera sp. TA3]|uniref:alpha/beta fold hydrolase n=1 Tax=Tundrisphaera sp. TA3 TaxID=3435775 RepID=UPI003EBB8915